MPAAPKPAPATTAAPSPAKVRPSKSAELPNELPPVAEGRVRLAAPEGLTSVVMHDGATYAPVAGVLDVAEAHAADLAPFGCVPLSAFPTEA